MADTEKLICLVYERKPFWDVQGKKCHNRDVARKLWLEIAEELKRESKKNVYTLILYCTLVITGINYYVSTTVQNLDYK